MAGTLFSRITAVMALALLASCASAPSADREGFSNILVDFFRYDYEEMDEPGAMNLLSEAQLDTDLYRASDSETVWNYSWSSTSADNIGALIDQSSRDIIKRLDRDKLIGP
ncbi:MAG: hypothetical protein ACR2QL_11415 [Woeseiaceae bacterium]